MSRRLLPVVRSALCARKRAAIVLRATDNGQKTTDTEQYRPDNGQLT
jgi:hypothetical protein